MAGSLLKFIGTAAIAGVLATVAITPAIALTGFAANNSIGMFENLPDSMRIDQLPQRTTIYAERGGENVAIASFYAENRESVQWDQVSQYAKDAAVAGEDPRFYEHGGVDPIGLIRAAASNLSGSDVQGASTITQQYVKNVQVTNATALADPDDVEAAYEEATQVTLARKAKEMRLAIGLEKDFTKDEILLGYLNIALFGGRVYGIQSAAQYYFDRDAKDLNISQSASLLAIVNNPEKFRLDQPKSETNGKENGYAATKERRDYILDAMLEYGKISQEQHDKAISSTIKPKITEIESGCESAGRNAYFCDYVVNEIKNNKVFGDTAEERYNNFIRGGFDVYTTLDLDLQKVAQESVDASVPREMDGVNIGAAAVGVRAGTGEILVMAQNKHFTYSDAGAGSTGVNFSADEDYGASSGFQAASTYKAFTLIAWLRAGHSLYESLNVSERTYDLSTFQRCDGETVGTEYIENDAGEGGYRSVLGATATSINGGFMAMGQQLDQCDIRKAATDLLVHRADGDDLQTNPGAILGTNEVAPLTMATAYAGIANNGTVCSPVAIRKMVNPDGTEAEIPETECTEGIEPKIANAAAFALRGVIEGGSATASNPYDGIEHLAKTGTTDGNTNTWTTGASSEVGLSVWVGQVKGSADLRNTYFADGQQAATARHRVWRPIMAAMDAEFGGSAFTPPTSDLLYGQQVTVPDVIGQSEDEAERILEDSGFTVRNGGESPSSEPEGTVISTDPGAGSTVASGTAITVYTSSGQQEGAAMPDLYGQQLGAVIAALQSAGLSTDRIGYAWVQGNASNQCTIAASDPAPGSAVGADTTITLTVNGTEAAGANGSFEPTDGSCG